jgi:hypothetical protein
MAATSLVRAEQLAPSQSSAKNNPTETDGSKNGKAAIDALEDVPHLGSSLVQFLGKPKTVCAFTI